ncbi:MAG: MiaB/RimO family radical SAM methylthiotransferase [Elusimicrobia bacterium]|nr:MiaB/RimO family radical SAM methylthiotransferase [Elusimicrobiota bacterium]
MKIFFKTFGCKVNQCETIEMMKHLQEVGCGITEVPDEADIVVINTCTVTSNADTKSRQYLRRYQRLCPRAKIFLTGCYVNRAKDELQKNFPKIKFFKNSQKQNILNILGLPVSTYQRINVSTCFHSRTRAFVKIQDGCDGKCTYCIVPKVRPGLFSKNPGEIIAEVNSYILSGHKEIVLCGIRLGKYQGQRTLASLKRPLRLVGDEARERSGREQESKRVIEQRTQSLELTDLIKELERIEGLCRIRLSSIELNDISDKLIELMAGSKKLCHHLHIPLQSGDDGILKSMRRPYTLKEFSKRINKIKKDISDIGITTDVIIGYPLDTEESLSNTYNFVKKCRFSRLHVFKFSERPGTSAEKLNRKCPDVLINKWCRKMIEMDSLLREKFKERFSGKEMEVLVEGNGCGYTSNYIHIKLPQSAPRNEIFSVNI